MVEKEWLDTLATINPNEVIYEDFVDVGNQLATKLKDELGCDIVIALTHMRNPNDIRLANKAQKLILYLVDMIMESRREMSVGQYRL